MERSDAIARLRAHEAELKRLGVLHLYLFGSTARDDAREDSDVDLFFDYEEGKFGLFELMDVNDAAARTLERFPTGWNRDVLPGIPRCRWSCENRHPDIVVEAVMPRPYSIDLRERVIAAVTERLSVREVGEIFDVSPSFVSKVSQRWRRSGRIDPLKSGGDRRSGAVEAQRDWLLQTIEATPDLTLREIRDRLSKRGTSTSKSSIARFFQRHRISCKKKTLHATERDRADVSAARAAWKAEQPEFDAA